MTMSIEAAAQALREAMRETVRRYSTWYLIQGVLMVIAGIVALIYPLVSSYVDRDPPSLRGQRPFWRQKWRQNRRRRKILAP